MRCGVRWRASVLVLVAIACRESDSSRTTQTAQPGVEPLTQFIEWIDALSLEEGDSVINVTPAVRLDWAGGFLVADLREAQLRRYSDRGKLLAAWGRRGRGPGEFTMPIALLRLRPRGELLAVDVRGRLSVFDSTGSELLETVSTPLQVVTDAEQVSESLLLLVGWIERSSPRLHLWDIDRQRLVRSFHEPFRGTPHIELTVTLGWNKAALKGDTIAAIYGASDTVYYFDRAGEPLGSVQIPFAGFRSPTPVTEAARMDEAAQKAWLASFDAVSDVFWLHDGLAILYQTNAEDGFKWHLHMMTADGKRLCDVRDVPKLLASDATGDWLYFVSPGSLTPNELSIARIRTPAEQD